MLQYRDNNYFNETDYFVVETNLNKLILTRVEFHRSNWFTVEGMQYKLSSVRSVNAKEISNKEVSIGEIEGKTTFNHLKPSFIGVIWNQGQGRKESYYKNPLYYWNNINSLKFNDALRESK